MSDEEEKARRQMNASSADNADMLFPLTNPRYQMNCCEL